MAGRVLPIADPGLVPVTVAAAIGLDLGGGAVSAQRVSQALAGRRLVLVLDTCEHVIGAGQGASLSCFMPWVPGIPAADAE